MRMRSRGCNGRHSQRVLLFLARRTLDADVAVELTAETLAPALSSWLAAVAGVDAGARAGLAVYGCAAPVRPVSADGRFVIESSAIIERMSCKPADCRPQSSVALVEI